MDHRQERLGQLLVPRRHATPFLQPAGAPLHRVAPPVQLGVEHRRPPAAADLIAPSRDDGPDAAAPQPEADARVAVALVAGPARDARGTNGVQGADLRPRLRHAARGKGRDLRVHRGVLQPRATPLVARLQVPVRVRDGPIDP